MGITIKNGENPSVSDVLTVLADYISHENGDVWSPSDEQAEALKRVFDGWDGIGDPIWAGEMRADETSHELTANLLEKLRSWGGWEPHGHSTIKTVNLGEGLFSLRVNSDRSVELLWVDPDGNHVETSRYNAEIWDGMVGLINEAELHRGNVVSSIRIGQ